VVLKILANLKPQVILNLFQNLKKERIMNKFELQKLRDLPIEGVAERLGLKITHFKTLCPFHNDNHPSLSIHVRRNSYKCFVCGAHGGVIDLVMQVLGIDFKEACRWLGAEDIRPSTSPFKGDSSPFKGDAGETFQTSRYERYFHRPYLNPAARSFLFTERKLHPGVIRWCRLHSFTDRHGTPWLQIPYFDVEGQLIGVQNRRLDTLSNSPMNGVGKSHPPLRGSERVPPRFLFPRGSKCSIYNLPVLKLLKPGEELWIAEGCSDCWALLSSGRKAIAIPSATLLRKNDLESLTPKLSTLNINMSPDADIPGEKLYLQLKQLFPQLVRHSLPSGIKDFAEYYMRSITNS
jgi:hypothetical protein